MSRYSPQHLDQAFKDDRFEKWVEKLLWTYSTEEIAHFLKHKNPTLKVYKLDHLSPLKAAQYLRENLRALPSELKHELATLVSVKDHQTITKETAPFKKLFIIFGIRRSGNHAIIPWLINQLGVDKCHFINSADPAFFKYHNNSLYCDESSKVSLSNPPENLIISYENWDPSLYPFSYNSAFGGETHCLLILRDFANTAASIAKGAHDDPAFSYRFRIRDFPDQWVDYAETIKRQHPFLKPLLFNKWVSEEAYRSAILKQCNIPEQPANLDHVSNIGGGSSFDGVTLNGKARAMNVLSRWTTMQEDRFFQFLMVSSPKAHALSKEIFGDQYPDYEDWMRLWQNQK